jgi:hypothetical protein
MASPTEKKRQPQDPGSNNEPGAPSASRYFPEKCRSDILSTIPMPTNKYFPKSGPPATYITLDIYGNLGFGFSFDLYSITKNIVDVEYRKFPNKGLTYPTSGFQVFVTNYGVYSTVSGIVPDLLAAGTTLRLGLSLFPSKYMEVYNRAVAIGIQPRTAARIILKRMGVDASSPNADPRLLDSMAYYQAGLEAFETAFQEFLSLFGIDW